MYEADDGARARARLHDGQPRWPERQTPGDDAAKVTGPLVEELRPMADRLGECVTAMVGKR